MRLMRRSLFSISLIVLVLSPLGCFAPLTVQPTTTPFGVFLFSHTVVPLDVNSSGEDLVGGSGRLNTKHWSYLVRLEWDGRGIGQIAKEHGFSHVDHADLEVLEFLGVWAQRHVLIYGTRE